MGDGHMIETARDPNCPKVSHLSIQRYTSFVHGSILFEHFYMQHSQRIKKTNKQTNKLRSIYFCLPSSKAFEKNINLL